jgi:hypothetical protein
LPRDYGIRGSSMPLRKSSPEPPPELSQDVAVTR